MQIDVRVNVREQRRALNQFGEDIRNRVVARALNEVAKQGRTQMTRAIANEFDMRQGEIRSGLTISRARATRGRLQFVVELRALQKSRGRGYNLIRFVENKVTLAEARRRAKAGTLRQIGFKIKRRGGIRRIPGAFIARNPRTGGTAVFMREGAGRLPVKALTTIDLAQMFNTRRINAKVVAFMRRRFAEILPREIAYYAGKARP